MIVDNDHQRVETQGTPVLHLFVTGMESPLMVDSKGLMVGLSTSGISLASRTLM